MTEPKTTRASVFISYSRRDRDFVQVLREACANDGRPAWLDTAEIRPVSEWSVEIAEGIDASDAVICVVSPDFVSSEQCAKELEHASRQKKRLVPVVARPVDPASLPPVLARLQWISFCDGTSFDAAFAALGSALDTDLDWLKAHTHLQNRAREWEASGQRASRLLRGRDLAEAETWLAGAHGRQPAPTPLQSQMVAASRRRATRTQRLLVSGLTGGLLVTLALAAAALIQRNAAREARDEAIAHLYTQQLAVVGNLVPGDPGLALDTLDETLRTAGSRREFTWDLYRNLSSRTVFAVGGMRNNLQEADRPAIALSRNGRQLATSFLRQSKRWRQGDWMVATEILLWDTATGQRRRTISVSETLDSDAGEIATLVFSSDDRQLAACITTYPGVVKVWDVATGAELMSVEEALVRSATFLDDPSGGRRLVVTGIGGMTIWDRIGPAAVKRRISVGAVHALAVDTRTSELVTAEPQGIVSRNLERDTQRSAQNPASATDPAALSLESSRIAQAIFDRVYVWRIGKPGVEWRLEGGHRESINVVAFSPDGRTLASGGADYVVRLWDLDRGMATRTLRGPTAGVLALEFSRDGRRLAAGSADASVFVWDVAGTPLQPSEHVETSGVPACAGFSAEHGAMLLTSADTVTLQRSTESGRPALLTIQGKVGSCGMTSDGRTLFLVDEQSRVLVADAATGTIRHRLDVTSRPESVRLSADGAFVAAYVDPRTFAVWSADQGTRLASIDVDGELEGPLALLDTGVVVAQFRKKQDSWIAAWDIRQAKRLSLTKVPAWTYGSQFAACSSALLSAIGEGDKVRIVDFAAGRITRELSLYERSILDFTGSQITKLVFSPDCSRLAIGDDAGQMSLWSLASGTRLYGILAHAGIQKIRIRDPRSFGAKSHMDADGVNAVAFSPDGRTLVSGGGTAAGRGELKLWDAERGALLATLPADAGSVKDARFFRAGGRLGVLLQRINQNAGGATTIVEVWSAESSERILLAADVEPIENLSFHADGRQLVTEASSAIKTWDLASRRLVASSRRPQPPSDARASGHVEARLRDNVGVFAEKNILYVEQTMKAPRPLLSGDETYFHSEPIQQLLVVGGDTLVSLAGYRNVRSKPAEIVAWDLSAGRPAHEALEPSNVVAGLAFSPDRRIFVTVGGIGTALQDSGFVHIWDAQRFTHIKALIGHRARVTAVAFSADGRQLATGDIKGFVRVWDVQQLTDIPRPQSPQAHLSRLLD